MDYLHANDVFLCYFNVTTTCQTKKPPNKDGFFRGAYETRTRDLLRDRQAF